MKLFLASITLALLVACGGTATKPDYYLLRADVDSQGSRKMDDSGIYLATVGVATYLDQNGLVLETVKGQTHAARYHLWAEPLRHSLKGFLATEVSRAAGRDVHTDRRNDETTLRIDVDIEQLHGTHDGEAVLVAYWMITNMQDGKQNQVSYQISKSRALESDGYAELVATEKSLLQDLAKNIAESLAGELAN